MRKTRASAVSAKSAKRSRHKTEALQLQKASAKARSNAGQDFEDIGAQLEVRRHPGARRLTLRVSRTRRAIVVTIPVQCDLDEAGSFLNRHIDWVREKLCSLPDQVPFANGAVMPLRGVPHRVLFDDSGCKSQVLQVTARGQWAEIRVPGAPTGAAARLRDWLFEEARGDLDASVALHAQRLGLSAKRIAVRDQTSRWGSCSTTGVLSFSWRLVLAPSFVLDYVAAHEVAHLAEMNHGPNFWALVRKTSPDFETAKRWLQVYGTDLHRYGSAQSAA